MGTGVSTEGVGANSLFHPTPGNNDGPDIINDAKLFDRIRKSVRLLPNPIAIENPSIIQIPESIHHGFFPLSAPFLRDRSFTIQYLHTLMTSPEFRAFVEPMMSQIVTRTKELNPKEFSWRAIAWITKDGKMVFGVELPNGCPPESAPAEFSTAATLVTMGRLGQVVGAYLWDERPHGARPISRLGQKILENHLDPILNDAVIIGRHRYAKEVFDTTFKTSYPDPTYVGVSPMPLRHLNPRPMDVIWQMPSDISAEATPRRFLRIIRDKLMHEAFGNVTMDGQHDQPARKGHLAAVGRAGFFVLSASQRDPDDPTQVICAERGALHQAYTIACCTDPTKSIELFRMDRIHSMMVYSEAYKPKNPDDIILPTSCPGCLGAAVQHIDPRVNNIRLIDMASSTSNIRVTDLHQRTMAGYFGLEGRIVKPSGLANAASDDPPA